MGNETVLVVAFDGLDFERIKEYDCEFLTSMNSFGKIDNQTNMHSIKTSELFASFITGENYEEHGVQGLVKKPDTRIKNTIHKLDQEKYRNKLPGWITLMEKIKSLVGLKSNYYTKEDLKEDSVFEVVQNSRAMFVPSYNPSIFTRAGAGFSLLESDISFSFQDYVDLVSRDFEYRKNQLMEELEREERNLLMCHFHLIDLLQHLEKPEDEETLVKKYQMIDKFAQNIKKKANYDKIIFMSDHGLPTTESHNKNAFFASNKKIFEEEIPKITDFYSVMSSNRQPESLRELDI